MRHVVAWFVVLRTLATAQHSIRDGAGSDINESAASGKEYCFCIHADQRDLFLAADTAAEQVRGRRHRFQGCKTIERAASDAQCMASCAGEPSARQAGIAGARRAAEIVGGKRRRRRGTARHAAGEHFVVVSPSQVEWMDMIAQCQGKKSKLEVKPGDR